VSDGLGRGIKTKGIVSVRKQPDNSHGCVRLGEVMKVTIGCVTGDVQYFLLRESRRIQLGLPIRALCPVLTRARHLKTASVTDVYWNKLRDADERVWLFRPESRDADVPSIRRYLRLGVKKGGCNRNNFKVRNRQTWYQPQVPWEMDGFLSGTSQFGPWISLNQSATLSVTNTLYCVKFVKHTSRNERAAWALSLFTREFREQYVRRARTYPEGLVKIEPGDLADLTLRCPPDDCKGAYRAYQDAVRLMLKNGRSAAEKVAKKWTASKEGQLRVGTSAARQKRT
jgi:hypothetical protein